MIQGTIFQILVLVTHGNLALSGNFEPDFYPQHSAFKFDEFVRFVDWEHVDGKWNGNEHPFADTPNDWLAKLKLEHCSGLRVARVSIGLSDRKSVGFIGGGGRWLIETVCPGGSDYWEAKWEVGDRNHPDQKIWRVTYGRIARNQRTMPSWSAPVDSLSKELGETLQDAISFSTKHKLDDGFGKAFASGYSALKAANEPELDGIAPKGQLPLPASRLLAASQAAWVFGGMGSWNDLGFEGDEQQKYEAISERLFRLMTSSLLAGTNMSFPRTEKQWWKFWQ
jgi:hypothetical protein